MSSHAPNRWVIALMGTLLQLCLGTVYAWSYFQSLLVKSYRWSYTDTAWAFSIVIFTLGLSAAWAGVNLGRYGPRKLAVIGGMLFSLSYVLGGIALYFKSIPLFYLGYSVVGGIGIGLGYVTPVSTVAKWFPDKKGLVTGVVVMGFGVGAFMMSKLLAPILVASSKGDLVPVFISLGVFFAVVLLPVTLTLRNPPATIAPSVGAGAFHVAGSKAYLTSGQFLMMWIMFFFNIAAGISVISFQSSLLQEVWGLSDPGAEPAVLAAYGATLIAVSSLFNGVGRLFWGMLSDRIGRVESFRLLLATQMVVFGVLMTERNPWIFSALVCYVLLCFGGGFGTMPSFVLDVFGSERMSVMYGAMLTAWAAAGVAGPLMVASLKDNYPDRAVIYCFLIGVLFLGSGFIVSFLVTNDACKVGKPSVNDLGIPVKYLKSSVAVLVLAVALGAQSPVSAQKPPLFDVFEMSILDLQAAQTSGRVTSRGLVESYLARIAAYDQAGPKLNAIVVLNPRAREDADALDKERASRGPRGPLHGIPVLIKDNYDTKDMPTSGGTLALAGMQPVADAFMVKKLRDAGAVILGKTTMHELAAGITTISSLTDQTRNPYDLMRTPGGSSGGTGAAIGASFAAAGMGSDTCGSIRIPSSNQSLVGLRGTQGLSSRTGIIPLSSTQDIGGPLARTVTDLAIMLDATVGADRSDPVTADSAGHIPKSYRDSLKADGLKGARIGVLKTLWGNAPEDDDVGNTLRRALEQMKTEGAEIIEVSVPGFDDLIRDSSVIADEFKFDLADFLANEPNAPVKSLGEIIDKGLHHAQLDQTFRLRNAPEKKETEHYRQAFIKRRALKMAVMATLEEQRITALAYPTLRRKPALIGEGQIGTTCQLSATTGLPAISMPGGFTADGLPVGLELLGSAWSEGELLKLAYAWEQSAKTRRSPFSTPALVNGAAPAPVTTEVSVGQPASSGLAARVRFTYDRTTGALKYDASVVGLGTDKVTALTLQRSNDGKPGPIIAHLLTQGQAAGAATLTLRGRDRDDLVAGNLFVHLYTRSAPLGFGRAPLKLPAR
jgi:amidase